MVRTHSHAEVSTFARGTHFSFHRAWIQSNTLLSPTHSHTPARRHRHTHTVCEFSVSFHLSLVCARVSSPMYRDYTLRWNTWTLATFYIYIPPVPCYRCVCKNLCERVCECMPFLYSHFANALVPLYTVYAFGLSISLPLALMVCAMVFFRV